MLILDKSRALDRMIWASGRHAVIVPDEFTHFHNVPGVVPGRSPDDLAWRWRAATATPHRRRRASHEVAVLDPAA